MSEWVSKWVSECEKDGLYKIYYFWEYDSLVKCLPQCWISNKKSFSRIALYSSSLAKSLSVLSIKGFDDVFIDKTFLIKMGWWWRLWFKYVDYSSCIPSVLRLILCLSTVSLDFVSDTNTIAYFTGYSNSQKTVIAVALN